jgi:hypothetical protein
MYDILVSADKATSTLKNELSGGYQCHGSLKFVVLPKFLSG